MVHTVSVDVQKAQGIKCSKGCEGNEERMLKCSHTDCPNYTHITCANVNPEELEQMAKWHCSRKCTEEDDVMFLRKRYDNQRILLNKTTDALKMMQAEYKKLQEKYNAFKGEVNGKVVELNEIIGTLKNEIQSLKAELCKAKEEKVSARLPDLDALIEDESDEELKADLTSIFKNCPVFQCSSPVAKGHKVSMSKPVSEMTETEKLTHYQRLQVQRLEVPKLMKYSGDAAEWLTFKASYERLRDKGEYDNETMIEKLRESLAGDAERYVKQRLNQPFAVADNIMEVLRKKFFQPKEAVANALMKLESWKPVQEKCRKELEAFLFEVDNYIYLCETLKFQPELEVAMNSRITNKLPYDVEMKWQQRISEKKLKGNIKEMSEFLWKIVPNLPLRDQGTQSQKAKATVNLAQPDENETKSSKPQKQSKEKGPCWFCGTGIQHRLYQCSEFKKQKHDDKLKFLSSNGICSRCLTSNQHAAMNCPRAGKLPKCKHKNCQSPESHCTLMHPPPSGEASTSASVNHVKGIARTMFKIVPVYVFDGNGNKIETTLLMDRAAGASLVNREFFERLGIEGEEYQLQLNWLQPNALHSDTRATRHDLRIAPLHDPRRVIVLHDMSALSGVVLPQQEQDPKRLKEEFPYLRNAKIPGYKKQRPQILLGLAHSKWMVSLETVYDDTQESAPIAEKTPLGWTVSGSHWSSRSVFHVCEGPEEECNHNDQEAKSESEILAELHETIKHFHSFDMLGVEKEEREHLNRDDATALKTMRHTMRQVGDRYEIGLYWRDATCTLPDNYSTALNRLRTTEQRLKKLGMIEWANEHHKALRDSGFVREASRDDLHPAKPHKRVNYVIGFVTFNENKQPPKPRWVVDTASKHQGVSLNSKLLKGPDNLIPLTQALLHFRERAVATVGDVTKMYHQILIKKEDQQVQRFLWRDCETNREPTIFIFSSMLFGPTCSPSQANSVRIDVAKKLKHKFPRGSRVALSSMYMDDEFNSEDTEEEAALAANEVINLFKTISWESVGFKSNSEATLKLLPVENVDEELVLELCSQDETLNRKVLGLTWNPKTDVFMFKVPKNVEMIALTVNDNYHPTKLEVLSFIMKIFDCLGMISHFVIRGKMILQSIWRCGIGWRQKIPDDIYEAWKKWIEKFAEIEKLQIPRHYGLDSRTVENVTLHVFVDASLEAYAAVAFIRFESKGRVGVCQIMSKCRVAPVKYSSVPKLELMAALIGARLARTIKTQHTRLKFESTTFWSDSITVLRWLYSPSLRLQQFVAPRVSEIQEISDVNDWRYVPTNLNVADDGTKWNDIDFSSPAQRWLIGPGFLRESIDEWPAKFPANVNLDEHKILIASLAEIKENNYYAGIIEGVSPKVRAKWESYLKVIAWVRRFICNVRAKVAEGKSRASCSGGESKFQEGDVITAEEINEAENLIFRKIQEAVWKEERSNLSKGRPIKHSSKLYALNAFLDNEGIIRSRTRMAFEESIPYDMKCPPILPNKHESVHAFIVHLHEANKHIGVEGTAAEARSRVWIIHVRSAVQRVKSRCLYCLEQKARQQIPPMAPMPSFRLTPTTKAFEHCGVDCCGPFTIYTGRSKHKRDVWVVVFTCMLTRAIYLRKLDSMTSDEMLLAIQDVWARRGPIRHMYSDNGRNFIGAARIIKSNHLQQLVDEKRLTWHFNPALTPQWGGAWERLIKEIKRAMKAEFKGKVVGEKVFECTLLQVEDIMNSRPLTNLPASPDDRSPLTPNYLMKLHPGYTFVCGESKMSDEDSRLYAKRAKLISEGVIKRWTKEYLSQITHPGSKSRAGAGLSVGDFVIYVDPQVKPSDWKRGVVAEVYRGRDGFARVADVKVSDTETLSRRSVFRLAKIMIDEKFFSESPCLLTTISERTLNPGRKLRFMQESRVFNKYGRIKEFFKKMESECGLSVNAIVRLWNELGQLEFYSREAVRAKKTGTTTTIAELSEDERVVDKNNERTIKIHRVPSEGSLMDIVLATAKLNWPVVSIIVDSIAQKQGCFVFLTLRTHEAKTNAIRTGKILIAERECRVTEPAAGIEPLGRASTEFGFFMWSPDKAANCFIFVGRQKNSRGHVKAMPRFAGAQLEEYVEYMKNIEKAFFNLVSKDPRPDFQMDHEEASDPEEDNQEPPRRLQSIVVKVPTSGEGPRQVRLAPRKERDRDGRNRQK